MTTLGVHPGDKALLSLDIITSVLLAMDILSPIYTCHPTTIIALLSATIPTTPITVGPLYEVIDIGYTVEHICTPSDKPYTLRRPTTAFAAIVTSTVCKAFLTTISPALMVSVIAPVPTP